jgi:hypothetical protein
MEKVNVSVTALIQRAKRGFLKDGQLLKIARAGSQTHSLGPFYTVGVSTNVVDCSNLNITDLAKDFLKDYEKLVD